MQIYVPLAQETPGDIFLLVRPVTGDPSALAAAVRVAIGRVDKDQRVSVRTFMTLEEVALEATARYRFRAVLVLTFAALALLLAMVGVFVCLPTPSSSASAISACGERLAPRPPTCFVSSPAAQPA